MTRQDSRQKELPATEDEFRDVQDQLSKVKDQEVGN